MKLRSTGTVIVMLLMALFVRPDRAEAAESTESSAVQAVTAAEIPVGAGGYSAGYNKYSDGSEGPQDFYVYGGKVYLLDSENDRILVYQGDTFQKCIELNAYCTMIEILDDEIYVLAWTKKEIRKYDMEGGLQASYPLGGCDASRIKGIVKDGNRVMIINDAGQTLVYNDFYHEFSGVRNDVELVDFSIHGKKKYSVNGISMIEYLTDVSSDYAILHRYNNQTDHLIGEEYIVKLCGEEPVGYYELDLGAWAVLPMRYFRVIDEKPYLMSCYKDKVSVREVAFLEGGRDIFLEDTAVFQEVLKKKTESADHTALVKSVSAANKTSLTRAQVISRAESMRTLYWTLEEKHKVVRGSAILPKVVADAATGRSFQGIPYCWGGFFGLSDIASEKTYIGKFADEIRVVFSDETMYMAGNVNGATPGYVGETIGLDCSGFISSAYGLSEKESTSTLKNTSNFYAVDLAKLQMGDMLVSSKEGHVYLYVGMKDEDTYVVYDCNSTESTGKVLKREISAEHIKVYEYVGRTPWSN